MNFKLDHIAIQTDNFDNTVQWYKDFFSCQATWDRTWEQLPQGIQARMPLATQLVELQVDTVRFHIFDIKENYENASTNVLQYQHFGIVVDTREELDFLKDHWIQLYQSGKYQFKCATMPTDIIPSPGGLVCFYAFDPNGLEFEVMHFS